MERKELIDESSAICKKCFQRGHFTYNCKSERKYLQRPSRTKLMKKLKNQQEKKIESTDSGLNKPDHSDSTLNDHESTESKLDEGVRINESPDKRSKSAFYGMDYDSKSNHQSSVSKVINLMSKKRERSTSSSSSDTSSNSSSSTTSSSSSSSSISDLSD